jgi:hypothetical protein
MTDPKRIKLLVALLIIVFAMAFVRESWLGPASVSARTGRSEVSEQKWIHCGQDSPHS